jgi:hypothetical protein
VQDILIQPGVRFDLKLAAQLRLYKALLCEDVLSKVQSAAVEACKAVGEGGSHDLTLKELLGDTAVAD